MCAIKSQNFFLMQSSQNDEENLNKIIEQISDLKLSEETIEITNETVTLNIEPDMTQPISLTIDPLRYLEKLPEFNGDQRELQTFIDLIDRIHPLLQRYDLPSQEIFSDLIKSKLKGRAKEEIEINYHVTTWTDVKKVLNNNFGDKLSASQLYEELRGLNFKTNAVDFYNNLKTILRRLNVKTRLEQQNSSTDLERNLNSNIASALNIFKTKMPEPMKSVLCCRNPGSLEDAMNILYEEGYAYTGSDINENKIGNPSRRDRNIQNRHNQERRENNFQPQFYNSRRQFIPQTAPNSRNGSS